LAGVARTRNGVAVPIDAFEKNKLTPKNSRQSAIESKRCLCLPQIEPEHIGDAIHPGSDGTECASCLGGTRIGASLFTDKRVRVPL
jgi:hypothetical protein